MLTHMDMLMGSLAHQHDHTLTQTHTFSHTHMDKFTDFLKHINMLTYTHTYTLTVISVMGVSVEV